MTVRLVLGIDLADDPREFRRTVRYARDAASDAAISLDNHHVAATVELTGDLLHAVNGWISVDLATALIGKHRTTVYRWVRDGLLPEKGDGVELKAVLRAAYREHKLLWEE